MRVRCGFNVRLQRLGGQRGGVVVRGLKVWEPLNKVAFVCVVCKEIHPSVNWERR